MTISFGIMHIFYTVWVIAGIIAFLWSGYLSFILYAFSGGPKLSVILWPLVISVFVGGAVSVVVTGVIMFFMMLAGMIS